MSKITPKDKTFLECMFNDLDDIYEGSDEQVKKELVDMGIDIDKAQKGFQATQQHQMTIEQLNEKALRHIRNKVHKLATPDQKQNPEFWK
jgi:hypothetical protein